MLRLCGGAAILTIVGSLYMLLLDLAQSCIEWYAVGPWYLFAPETVVPNLE